MVWDPRPGIHHFVDSGVVRNNALVHYLGSLQVSQMVDVYSFGILLAFLFTGRHSKDLPSTLQVRGCNYVPHYPRQCHG